MIIEAGAGTEDGKRKLKIEPTLTRLLTTSRLGRKDAPPLLIHAGRIYREYGADGDLRLEEYRALGGIEVRSRGCKTALKKRASSDDSWGIT